MARKRDRYAANYWTPEDVMEEAESSGIKMTKEQACEFLEKYESKIVDAMVEGGWEAIKWYLTEDFTQTVWKVEECNENVQTERKKGGDKG